MPRRYNNYGQGLIEQLGPEFRPQRLGDFEISAVYLTTGHQLYVKNNAESFQKSNAMSKLDFEAMSLDELWTLHELLSGILAERIVVEKRELEQRLVQLNRGREKEASSELNSSDGDRARQRRKYPRVLPKYQNPSMPTETWSGRGKKPRWLVSALTAGRKIEDFKITSSKGSDKT